ncbi:Predicted arabinose efflux permease, MFS family [Tessaracoccus bendigoensis DSM 12906]|uniref:Predicted arabinose efflux permease, MFS family n=1 Tax=Tessaracoccus bendigoensis DSM 12906 TaxID=1123357 RepID=A0A1M6DKJ5_9ACTN|nr:MFS transporter [Tessaracoccus bendigoensis]SHI73834.1 Predicted arabinose efflux permease, MFS family [Tessaracoccus bendigoensis DSM 12906]
MRTRQPIPSEIWVLVCAAFLIALGYGLVAPILPQFARSFDVGVVLASAIVTVFALVRLIFAPAGGALVAKFGERRIYLIGLFIVAVSSALSGLAPDYWTLMAFRGLGGIGSVMFTVSSMGLLVRLSPPAQRGHTSSLYGTAFLLGNILGPTLGSLLQGFGMRIPFFIYAAAVLVAALVVTVFLRGGAGGRPLEDDARAEKMTLAEALGLPYYRALLLTAFAHGWSNFGVRIALLPLMAASVPAIGEAAAGLALTLFALGNAVTQQATGRLIDQRGRRPFLVLGLAISAAATAPFGWLDTLPWFLVLATLAGVGAAFIAPASQALLADLIGSNRNGGQALSTYSMATDLGSIAGTLLAGTIAQLVGFGWAFAATALVMIAAAMPWFLVKRKTP